MTMKFLANGFETYEIWLLSHFKILFLKIYHIIWFTWYRKFWPIPYVRAPSLRCRLDHLYLSKWSNCNLRDRSRAATWDSRAPLRNRDSRLYVQNSHTKIRDWDPCEEAMCLNEGDREYLRSGPKCLKPYQLIEFNPIICAISIS